MKNHITVRTLATTTHALSLGSSAGTRRHLALSGSHDQHQGHGSNVDIHSPVFQPKVPCFALTTKNDTSAAHAYYHGGAIMQIILSRTPAETYAHRQHENEYE